MISKLWLVQIKHTLIPTTINARIPSWLALWYYSEGRPDGRRYMFNIGGGQIFKKKKQKNGMASGDEDDERQWNEWWGNTLHCFDWPSGADLVTGSLIGVLRLPRDVCVSVCVIFAAPRTSDGFITRSFVLGWHLQWGAVTGWQEIPGLRLSWLFKSVNLREEGNPFWQLTANITAEKKALVGRILTWEPKQKLCHSIFIERHANCKVISWK